MARWMPGATKRPLPVVKHSGKRSRTDGVVFHVDAGNSSSLFGQFSSSRGQAGSVFYIQKDGGIEQYMDADLAAWTSGEGNYRTLGVETQGYGPGKWTEAQLESIARIIVWVHEEYGIPLRLMESSHSSEKGVGWHRLGVNGNFPDLPNIQAGREQRGGGELWSSSVKTCPGNERVEQMPAVLERAKCLVGSVVPTTPEKPAEPVTGGSTGGIAPVLRLGTKSNEVKAMQSWLKALFSYGKSLAVDGSFGPATEKSVKAFQKATGLDQDGIVGPNTRARMVKEGVKFNEVRKASKPAPKPKPAPIKVRVNGKLDTATIKAWQRQMGTPIDGVISEPSQLIKKVQKVLGVEPDGLFGPITIRALQRRMGTTADGVISTPSQVITELQRRLNGGDF